MTIICDPPPNPINKGDPCLAQYILSGLSTQASVDINAAQAGQASVISGGINALGNIAGSYMQANATNSNQPTLNPDGSVKQ